MDGKADPWRRGKRRLRLPDGRALAYVEREGEGRPWLLIHGYSDTSRSYQPLLPHLGRRRLLIPDLPGHGDSDPVDCPTLEGLAGDLLHLVRSCGEDPGLVVGHSLGSLLALQLAAGPALHDLRVVLLAGTPWPACTGLAFLDPVADLADPPGEGAPFLDGWYAGPLPVDPAFVQSVRGEAARMPKATWLAYRDLIATADLTPRLRTVAAPVLVLSGALDPLFPPPHAALLETGLAGARVVRLRGHGHNPHWEDPARIAALMAGFAAKHR